MGRSDWRGWQLLSDWRAAPSWLWRPLCLCRSDLSILVLYLARSVETDRWWKAWLETDQRRWRLRCSVLIEESMIWTRLGARTDRDWSRLVKNRSVVSFWHWRRREQTGDEIRSVELRPAKKTAKQVGLNFDRPEKMAARHMDVGNSKQIGEQLLCDSWQLPWCCQQRRRHEDIYMYIYSYTHLPIHII